MRKEAEKRGLDPDKWFNNVEIVTAEKIGIETTTYVRNIYKYYVSYKLTQEAQADRRQGEGEGGRAGFRKSIAASLAHEMHAALDIETLRGETKMKRNMQRIMLLCIALVGAFTGVARADEIAQVTGVHWTKATEQEKKAYLIGIANIAEISLAYQGANPSPDAQSILPRMRNGLKGETLDSVREGLNRWYAAHPDRVDRPVVETIWFEMVVPGLNKNK